MSKIKSLIAREILDSRGYPTVETRVNLDDGWYGISSVPSGVSVGRGEALGLRDQDPSRYLGKGVLKAVANVNQQIASALINKDPLDQSAIDQVLIDLDGTPNKQVLGANAILSVSQAVCKAAAASQGLPLYSWVAKLVGEQSPAVVPVPIFNVINGGLHGADNLDFQEFHLIPSSYSNFAQALQITTQVYHQVKDVLIRHKAVTSVGDEGGFAPVLFTNMDAFEVIKQAVIDSGFIPGQQFLFGLDSAANYLLSDGRYRIRDKTESLDANELIGVYEEMVANYPIVLIEDPLEEGDWHGWQRLTARLGHQVTVVGDDLLVTRKDRLERAISDKAANAVLIKPNQVGTISETLEVVKLAKESSFKIITSHRSGETNDTFIADLAVGIKADYTKFGAPARGERVAKYNRLLAIESQLTQNS